MAPGTAGDVWSFAFGARSLSHCSAAVRCWVARAIGCHRTWRLAPREQQLLLAVLQGQQQQEQLRKVLRKLLSTSLPE